MTAAAATASDIATRTDAQPRFQGATLPEIAGPPLAERLDHLATAQTTIDSTLSMLSPDDARRSDWSNRLDRLVSTAFSDDEVDAEIELLLDDAEVIRGGVVPPVPFTFTLAGREGDINLRIGNRLGEPITVVVRASSPRLTFSDGDGLAVAIPEYLNFNMACVLDKFFDKHCAIGEILLAEPAYRVIRLFQLGPILA